MGKRQKQRARKKAAQTNKKRKREETENKTTKKSKIGDDNGKYATGRILIVGDGDFSFSLAVALSRGGAEDENYDLVCTCLDSRKGLVKKYGKEAAQNFTEINERPTCHVLFEVDATRLAETVPKPIAQPKFDKIIFNFPHTGSQRVHENRAMLSEFFSSARAVLRVGGSVHVTMNEGPPYCNWDIESIASESGMGLVNLSPFRFQDFPGYRHRTTLHGAATPDPRNSRTYEFMPIC